MSANSRAQALVEAMQRLATLFEEENAAIRSRNLPALTDIASRKTLMVRTYEDCVRSIKYDPDELRTLDEAVRESLKQETERFIDHTLTHARLARAAAQVTQSTVNTMVNAINRARAEEGAYTRRGGMVMPAAYARKTAPSMTLDRRL
ncbi:MULTISPECIES: hypothetical protein [Azospirillaceae]|uniref:hypothetical protein n=1 Tax=Azospirillaceae TaxID=2829815 RepID=UPI000B647D1D|nr:MULTISPECIES: hypothetical protein [Azospirillaceae]MDG5493484.1 hypothetical protein [Niveispirillum sp. BGYR6]SNS11584.1 hypothetical protein SAMN05880556_10242 [Azospirillum sp. RU38E]SNS28373.1 hypothetical protein SAMN05880591_10242 [Azospirillum sp. RU37A]